MLFEPQILDLIRAKNDEALMESDFMPELIEDNQLMLYKHTGYWQSMKTLKDALTLKKAWGESQPWKVW